MTAIRSCDNTSPSHIVYTFNILRNVDRSVDTFNILDRSAVTKLLPQVHFSQDILLKTKKNAEVQVNMQRVIQNNRSFSGSVIKLNKILNLGKWIKVWFELCVLSYGWYVIKNIVRKEKK